MDITPSLATLIQHAKSCQQCQDAAQQALVRNQIFWNEETWSAQSCAVGNQLRLEAIQELS